MKNKVLILGAGVSGRSAAAFVLEKKEIPFFVDKSEVSLEEARTLFHSTALYEKEDALHSLPADISRIIPSPGVSPTHPLLDEARRKNLFISSEIEEALDFSPATHFLGVTGTNGKTTVVHLIEHVLQKSGVDARAGGNNGIPLSSLFLGNTPPPQWVILELSSFQIDLLKEKPFLKAASILNITPDHLDRYGELTAYASSKSKIQKLIEPRGHFYINKEALSLITLEKHSKAITFNKNSLSILENTSLPPHQKENYTAAFALAAHAGTSFSQFFCHTKSFQPPPHRISSFHEWKGITFVNDSKSTNLDSTIAAIGAVNNPIILIAGGVAKEKDFLRWKNFFHGKVKCIVTIGSSKNLITEALKELFLCKEAHSLEEAISLSVEHALPGDTILLSPGCASYDMFKNYTERGTLFEKHVRVLCP